MDDRFSFKTVENFDEHIEKSIIGYSDLINDVLTISDYFIEENTNVLDLGCSTGKLINELAARHNRCLAVGIDMEDNFAKNFSNHDNVSFVKQNLFDYQGFANCSFITSLFTIQFLQQHLRRKLITNIYKGLNYGGAFVFCEKMLSNNAKFQDMLTFMYYDYKQKSFSPTQIFSKEKDLRQMMKLFSMDENLELLKEVGFRQIEVFWKRYLFTGIIAIK